MTQTGAGEGVTTFTEDFAEMDHIVRRAMSAAGVSAVMGTIGERREAVYGMLSEPPRLVQIALTGHDRLTATVSVVGVTEEDEPTAEVGRFTYGSYTDDTTRGATAEEIFAAATNTEFAPRAQVKDVDRAAELFDAVYENLQAFTPKQ